ncbi:hypothetical protein EHQ76_10220 [Leptospira barantonii]|uniref:Uncharacterized protein n=1 Tax=Leptospira barantonii TaxID=2023184 RepID=A0A5F2BC09_9LEPT|nr:hypothetical protein [Leptospira barantonii]TGM03134.1 hypothetical protein EHQ76_10220 [Leptospira barantonii]
MKFFSAVSISLILVLIPSCQFKNNKDEDQDLLRRLVVGSSTPSTVNKPSGDSQYYRIGGSITGLTTGANLTLAVNGTDQTIFNTGGPFLFPFPYPDHTSYVITVLSSPPGLTCTVIANANGAISGANATTTIVSCS